MEKEEGVVRNEGIDRRRLLKRGAVVGGTLLWAAPLIQTIGPAAQAHNVPGSPRHGCCECTNCDGAAANAQDRVCIANGCLSQAQCDDLCANTPAFDCAGPNATHCGPNPIGCSTSGASAGQCLAH